MSEEQLEEFEVLESIYGSGDECYKALSSSIFQYKFGEEGDITSFLLEIRWPELYPSILPIFNLDAFYNQHLSSAQKEAILELVNKESNDHEGEAQTFTIIEWVRENFEKLQDLIRSTTTVSNALTRAQEDAERKLEQSLSGINESTSIKLKKEQLTKSQKRKEWNRVEGGKGEKPRGYDWVDVLKHLSQTGHSQLDSTDSHLPPPTQPV